MLYDTLSRAALFAGAAVCTFAVIDNRETALNGDRLLRACSHALLAGYASDLAVFHDRFALVGIYAADMGYVIVRNFNDKSLRARGHALLTVDAVIFGDDGNTFFNVHRVILAHLSAVSAADTAEAA